MDVCPAQTELDAARHVREAPNGVATPVNLVNPVNDPTAPASHTRTTRPQKSPPIVRGARRHEVHDTGGKAIDKSWRLGCAAVVFRVEKGRDRAEMAGELVEAVDG
jgi:hypothetical protein